MVVFLTRFLAGWSLVCRRCWPRYTGSHQSFDWWWSYSWCAARWWCCRGPSSTFYLQTVKYRPGNAFTGRCIVGKKKNLFWPTLIYIISLIWEWYSHRSNIYNRLHQWFLRVFSRKKTICKQNLQCGTTY